MFKIRGIFFFAEGLFEQFIEFLRNALSYPAAHFPQRAVVFAAMPAGKHCYFRVDGGVYHKEHFRRKFLVIAIGHSGAKNCFSRARRI